MLHALLCFGFEVTLREGSREYYYKQLDAHFPGLKTKYIKRYGNSYMCTSPNNERLIDILRSACQKHRILWGTDRVFHYLRQFETKTAQLSLW